MGAIVLWSLRSKVVLIVSSGGGAGGGTPTEVIIIMGTCSLSLSLSLLTVMIIIIFMIHTYSIEEQTEELTHSVSQYFECFEIWSRNDST